MIKKITLKNGQTRWEARWRDTTGEHRHRFRTRKDAEAALQLGRDRRQRRKAGLPEEQPPITYAELVERFLAQSSNASDDWARQMLGYSVGQFGRVLVRDLLSDRIGSWLHRLNLSPKTKTHILEKMRQVLNAGVEWGYLSRNPARPQAVRAPKQVESDIRPFRSWEEVDQIARPAGAYEPLVLVASATGLRPEEWIPLCWNDLHVQNRIVRVERVWVDGVVSRKSGKTDAAFRPVALQQRALDALALMPRPLDGSQLIFPAPQGGLIDLDNWRRRVWKPAFANTPLEYRPLYQMRHTYATLGLQAGADLYWLSKQLGHTDIRTTLRFYTRFENRVDERNLRILDEWAA